LRAKSSAEGARIEAPRGWGVGRDVPLLTGRRFAWRELASEAQGFMTITPSLALPRKIWFLIAKRRILVDYSY
jgi:hypothetical protein